MPLNKETKPNQTIHHKQDVTQGQFLKQILTSLNPGFSLS